MMDETDRATKNYGAKLVYGNLDTNKVYARFAYRTYFIEFEDMETHDKWKKECKDVDSYAFYDGCTVHDLKGGERGEFINQFIKKGLVENEQK